MNKLMYTFCFVLGYSISWGQQKELVDQLQLCNYLGKSYIYTKGVTIKAAANCSFIVNASTHGTFFIRPAGASLIPSNIPPSLDKNFVREESILKSGVTQENHIPDLVINHKSVQYKYIDGMGREMESVKVRSSPQENDVITANYFDGMGFKRKEYLAYTFSQKNGGFRGGYDAETKTFYSTTPQIALESLRPYTENIYESSSLHRVETVYGPGNDWYASARKNQTKTKISPVNTIRKWIYVDDNTPPTLSVYDTLLIKEIIDEENHATREFIDKRGLTVLKQKQASGDYINSPGTVTWFETYFIYDDLAKLKIVVSPEGSSRIATEYITDNTIKNDFLKRWCFQYRYDDKGNTIAKWIPGWIDWQYMVYDRWNRVVLTQNPAQRARNEWTFSKYDRFNRAILSGIWITSKTVSTLRSDALVPYDRFETELTTPGSTTPEGYTLTLSYPTSITSTDLLSITYYDNYNFLNCTNWDLEGPNTNYNFVNITGYPQTSELLTLVPGHVTGTKTKILKQSQWLNSVTRYDTKYRAVQLITENHLGGRNRETSKYDFTGRLLQKQIYHASSVTSLTVLREFSYDHAGRLLKLYQTTDTGPRVLMASNKYNEIGQLVEKNIHSLDEGMTFLQSMDYRYNIRGWLTSINNSTLSNDGTMNNDTDDIFGMELLYNPVSPLNVNGYPTAKLYDGNISAIKWRTDTKQGSLEERAYGFEYDVSSRLKKAYYATKNGANWNGSPGMFEEQITSYDNNGNIKGINRSGKVEGAKVTIDNLTHSYLLNAKESNRLISVNDASSNIQGFKDSSTPITEEYRYDDSGNLIYDNNKSISSISYNHLNLPEFIEFTYAGGVMHRIKYVYDANGSKLSTIVWKDGNTSSNGTQVWRTDYSAEVQYDDSSPSNNNKQLTFASTPEGRVVKNNTEYDYEYFLKDHQGNVRLTYGLMKETLSYRATMENPPAPSTLGNDENSRFKNIATTRATNVTFNYTKSSSLVVNPDKASETSGYLNKPIGPAKSLRVFSGDKVSMEVFAKYLQPSGNTATIATSVLVAALANTTFGYTSGETAYTTFNTNAPGVAGSGNSSATVPKAYLAYLFFDDYYNFVAGGSSAIAITTSAYNAFERLSRTFTANQNGYLYIYVANESNTSTSTVYFDEISIVHQKNNNALQVTQASDYYPFGLSFNEYQSERITNNYQSILANRYKFNGKEEQREIGLIDFGNRMYDGAIARWMVVDPFAHKLYAWSPYNYALDNPIIFIDPDGALPWPIHIRSFIYTPTTGAGAFRGDGRGTSLASYPDVTSRVRSSFIVDPGKGRVSNLEARQDFTLFHGILGSPPLFIPPMVKEGKPKSSIVNVKSSENTTSFNFSHSGKDPITPSFITPELDVHAALSVTEDLEQRMLTIKGTFTGDTFPSTEAFVVDQSGENKVFLGAKLEEGGIIDLYGDNKESLFKVDIKIQFDDKGNFIDVQHNGKTFTVEEWNKNVQEGFKEEVKK